MVARNMKVQLKTNNVGIYYYMQYYKETQKGINGELHVEFTSGICWYQSLAFTTLDYITPKNTFKHICRLSQLHQCD